MQEPRIPQKIAKFIKDHPDWQGDMDLLIMPPQPQEILEEYPEAISSDVLKGGYTTDGVPSGAHYMHLRRRGTQHRMAEMLACQKTPAIMTDSIFKAGMKTIGEEYDHKATRDQLNHLVGAAKAQGYTPGKGDIYFPELARFKGDKEAFVPPTEGRSYIKKLCEKRGWACEGAVNVGARAPESDPYPEEKRLAPDIIDNNIRRMAEKNPDILRANRRELRKKITETHGMG